jgi:hypothetical protein
MSCILVHSGNAILLEGVYVFLMVKVVIHIFFDTTIFFYTFGFLVGAQINLMLEGIKGG